MKSQRQRFIGFQRSALTPSASPTNESKVDFIRKGKKKKTITKVKDNRTETFESQGGKLVVVEKETKVEEEGVSKKKRNYIMYESKLGTEKERDMTRIAGKKMREVKPRVEERIIIKRKRNEYLDNYQYHETKCIRNPKPRNTSYVAHRRKGDIIGGSYEQTTYERQILRTNPIEPTLKPVRVSASPRSTSSRSKKSNFKNKPSTQTYTRQPKNQYGQYKVTSPTSTRRSHQLEKPPATSKVTKGKLQNAKSPRNTQGQRKTSNRGGKTSLKTRSNSGGRRRI